MSTESIDNEGDLSIPKCTYSSDYIGEEKHKTVNFSLKMCLK